MRKLPFLLLAVAAVVPAVAQPPISGIRGGGSGREESLRRQWLGTGDRLAPDRDPQQDGQLLGQLHQLDRRVERERDAGLISRGDARRFFRESESIGRLYAHYSDDGLSAAEAAELQNRIYVLRSTPLRPREGD